jgi:hypothetical protein
MTNGKFTLGKSSKIIIISFRNFFALPLLVRIFFQFVLAENLANFPQN